MLRLHATSAGHDPLSLAADSDLVLEVPVEHGDVLPAGVLAEDHLGHDARAEVDAQAHAAIAAWRGAFDDALAHDGVLLAEVWHSELFIDVFLATIRATSATSAALAGRAAGELTLHGIGPATAAALRATLAPGGWRVTAQGPPAQDRIHPAYAPPPLRLGTLAEHLLRLPAFGHGDVLVFPYGPTNVILDRLLAGSGPRPVVHPLVNATRRRLPALVRRGGAVGRAGGIARARSRRRAAALIAAARDTPFRFDVAGADIGPALHARALDYLSRRALDSFAQVEAVERGLRRTGVRAALLPFDWDPPGRVVVVAARRRRVPVLSLQHGYQPHDVFVPGGASDWGGVWSHWDLENTPRERRPRTRVVGSPSRAAGTPAARRGHAEGKRLRAVVLVQHHFRPSARIDGRITAQHVAVAVEGIRATGRDIEIVVRPHPSDPPESFAPLVERHAARMDATTPMRELLASADLCVGSTSTAALETALVGIPLVMLNPSGWPWTAPLDGSGEVLNATDATELARAIETALDAEELPGRAELLAALGDEVEDSAGLVISWLEELVA